MSLAITANSQVQLNNCVLQTQDIDETISVVKHHLWPHEMKVGKSRGAVNTQILGHLLGDLSVLDLTYGAEVEIKPEAADYYAIHVPISGYSELHYGNIKSQVIPGTICITAPSSLSYVYMDEQCRHLNIRVGRAVMENYLSHLIGRDVYEPLIFVQETPSNSSAGNSLINSLDSLFKQARTVPEMFVYPQIADQYKNLIMSILLSMFDHSYTGLLQKGGHSPVPWHVRQAKDYIEENLEDFISLAKLAEFVGVSARTLQNGFRQFEGMSPAEYIRNRRLQRLHHSLLSADPASRITEIMLDQGITSFGRYAHYYQERYSCLPSETLKK